MNQQQFVEKWNKPASDWTPETGYWISDASHFFWARSENMPKNQLIEMSKDFLSIPEIKNKHCSSVNKAKNALEGN